jgi:hypothetical protein
MSWTVGEGNLGTAPVKETNGEVGNGDLGCNWLPRSTTAEAARQTVERLEADLIIDADQVAAISRDQDGKYQHRG